MRKAALPHTMANPDKGLSVASNVVGMRSGGRGGREEEIPGGPTDADFDRPVSIMYKQRRGWDVRRDSREDRALSASRPCGKPGLKAVAMRCDALRVRSG